MDGMLYKKTRSRKLLRKPSPESLRRRADALPKGPRALPLEDFAKTPAVTSDSSTT